MNMLNQFPDAVEFCRIFILIVLMVFLAVTVDLIFGLAKAKLRGEVRSSWGLKRTAQKILTYGGALLVVGFMDYLIQLCRFFDMFGLHILKGVPILTCLMGLFFLVVEVISMIESADKKTKTEVVRGSQVIKQIAENKELIEKLTAITEMLAKEKTTNECA